MKDITASDSNSEKGVNRNASIEKFDSSEIEESDKLGGLLIHPLSQLHSNHLRQGQQKVVVLQGKLT